MAMMTLRMRALRYNNLTAHKKQQAAVIRGTDSNYNFFSGVLGEPGDGVYLQINGSENTVRLTTCLRCRGTADFARRQRTVLV